MNIYKSVTELVGKTPLMELARIEEKEGLGRRYSPSLSCSTRAGA